MNVAIKPLRGMYNACVSLQERHLEALRNGDGRGLSTVEMAEHLGRESGYRELYEAACQALRVLESHPNEGSVYGVLDRAITKAKGEKP